MTNRTSDPAVTRYGSKMVKSDYGDMARFSFYCPACDEMHTFQTGKQQDNGACWNITGTEDKPSFSPSLLMYAGAKVRATRCHLFVTDGKIHYCDDCPHEYAGKTIEMLDFPNPENWVD